MEVKWQNEPFGAEKTKSAKKPETKHSSEPADSIKGKIAHTKVDEERFSRRRAAGIGVGAPVALRGVEAGASVAAKEGVKAGAKAAVGAVGGASRLARGVKIGGAVASVALAGIEGYAASEEDFRKSGSRRHAVTVGVTTGVTTLGGALAGAKIGAMIGTAIGGPVGTLVGGVGGLVIGAAGAYLGAKVGRSAGRWLANGGIRKTLNKVGSFFGL